MTPAHWDKLVARAQKVVAEIFAELPAEIAAEARQVPILYEPVCEDDPDLMGTYGNFTPHEIGDANGPITLYLQTIAEICDEDGLDFADEVRITYLHELGHHLGWDEGELEERGL